MNRKGIFFTIAAIALTAAIIVTYGAFSQSRLNERMDNVQTRIDTVNFFIRDVENDLEKGAYIASFRTLLGFNQYISSNGTYITNLEGKFRESFLNGTIDGIPIALMQGSTFTDWANKMSTQAGKIDISLNFSISEVSLNQSDPWNVDVGVNITLQAIDKKNTSSWRRSKIIIAKVGIAGFEDPLYTVKTGGRVVNSIVVSNISPFVVIGPGQTDNLLAHMNSSYYIAHNDSPSFLMRLSGDMGSSAFGIESLVNLEELSAQGISLKDRSIVDYIYFGTNPTANYRINNTPFWFRLDQDHLDIYGVTNITI